MQQLRVYLVMPLCSISSLFPFPPFLPHTARRNPCWIIECQPTQYRAHLIMASFQILMTGSCRYSEGFSQRELSLLTYRAAHCHDPDASPQRESSAGVLYSQHIVPSFTDMYPIPGGKKTYVSIRTLTAVGIFRQ